MIVSSFEAVLSQPRILVVGTSGSGKTTLAACLAAELGYTHIELDSLYWAENWTPRSDFHDRVRATVQAPTWVADGNYGTVQDVLWPRAAGLIWLNLPFPLVFTRLVSRTLRRRVTRELLFGGNYESLRMALTRKGILWWAITTHGKHKRRYPELLSQPAYSHLRAAELRSARDVNELIATAIGIRRSRTALDMEPVGCPEQSQPSA